MTVVFWVRQISKYDFQVVFGTLVGVFTGSGER